MMVRDLMNNQSLHHAVRVQPRWEQNGAVQVVIGVSMDR